MKKNEKKKVSVIIVTYNQEDYIARTLDAVLDQDCTFDYEIIISDDCSTDRTPEICKKYAQAHPDKIRYFRNTVNKGLIRNYYGAISHAGAEYLADCGGDDVWCDRHKLQKQIDILDSDKDIVLVHTDWDFLSEIDDKTRPSDPYGKRAKFHPTLTDGSQLTIPLIAHTCSPIIHTSSMAWRTDALMECITEYPDLFSNPEWPCEDLQLVVALSTKGKIAYIPEVTMLYSIDKPSITSTENPAKIYRFYIGSVKLTRRLQTLFCVSDSDMAYWYQAIFRYLLTQAMRLRDKEKVETLEKMKAKLEIRIPLKVKLKFALAKILSR